MPLPKFKTSASLDEATNALGYTEYQKSFMERRKGVVKMLNTLWPEGGGNDVNFIREEDGQTLRPHELAPPETGNSRDVVRVRNGMDRVVAFFDSNPKGRLQILSPEDNKPHYLSMSEDKSEFVISDEVAPAPPAPQKPSLWDRFKSIFTKVPSVERYNAQKKEYDSYNDYCKKAKDISDKRKPNKEQAKQQEKQPEAKRPEVKQPEVKQPEVKQPEVQEKKVAAQPKTVSAKHQEETFENIQPKNDVAKNFFAKVDAAVAQNDRLKHAGLMAKKSMNRICYGIGEFNDIASNYKTMGNNVTVTHMATIMAFNAMKEYPDVLKNYETNPLKLTSKLANNRSEFITAIGVKSEDGVTKDFVDQFLQSGGESMAKDMKKILNSVRIFPEKKLQSNVPQVSNDAPSLGNL